MKPRIPVDSLVKGTIVLSAIFAAIAALCSYGFDIGVPLILAVVVLATCEVQD
jgi:hypothetical protein